MTDELTREPPAPDAPERVGTGAAGTLLRRWPTALALAFGALILGGMAAGGAGDTGAVTRFAELLVLLPLIYLVVAATGRRGWSWPVLVCSCGLLVAVAALDRVEPVVVFLAVALAAVVWGSAHGRHRRPGFVVQLAGMVAFGALALLAMAVDPDAGRYLVAAGWFAHGVWDLAHLRADAVISRSYAEACGVLDMVVAAGLIAVPLVL